METYTLRLLYASQKPVVVTSFRQRNLSRDSGMASPRSLNQSTDAMMAMPNSTGALELIWQAWCQLLGSEVVATGILILILDIALRIPRNLGKLLRQESWSDLLAATGTDLMFVLDSAIEYPLFFAFHPVTLSSAGAGAAASSKPFPEVTQLAFQVAALYFVEYAFDHFVLRRICFPSADSGPVSGRASKSTKPPLSGNDDHGMCDDAAHLAMEFFKPRGALLLAISVYYGAFHPLSMVTWAASRQMFVVRRSDDERCC